MAIISGNQFFGGQPGKVIKPAIVPTQPTGQTSTSPYSGALDAVKNSTTASRPGVRQIISEAETAQQEADQINSPMGQVKEFGKAFGEKLGTLSGITPTGKRIAAGISPYVTPEEELPYVLEELDPGGMQKTGGQAKELLEIALDLPVISLGLSKQISRVLAKQSIRTAPELAKFLARPLSEFAPDVLDRLLKTDLSTPVKEAIGNKIESVVDMGQAVKDKAKLTLFGKEAKQESIDDVIEQADKALPSEARQITEEATSKPNLLERWAGIRPDIKNRIKGKQDKLKEYFDVAHARNNFDTLPTPLEHGAKNVDNAVSKLEAVLNDTGSDIGKFRQKVSTYQANIDQVGLVETKFNNELSRLNLEVKNGVIRQKAGTVTKVNSESEIKALNELYGDLQTVKSGPNLERLIDLRNLFDSKINFAKSSREVSSSLDPLSRNVRKQIADVSAEIVGKSEAVNLQKYSEFMDAYNNLRSFTDRKAGAEFLLKQVLSEKGGASREVIQAVKDITGIDLMDDAVMAQIATDLIGNSAQKGVFRQEITKAGLDASRVLRGDPSGAIDLLYSLGKKGLINEEKQFLKAAQ